MYRCDKTIWNYWTKRIVYFLFKIFKKMYFENAAKC